MCNIDGSLHLCSCSKKIDTKQPHWRLYRKMVFQPDVMVIGKITEPYTMYLTADALLTQLNERNCFDFNYQPLDDDKLVIKLNNETIELVFDRHDQFWRIETPSLQKIRRSMQAKGYVRNHFKADNQ